MDFGKTVRLRCTVTVSVDYKVIEINNVNLYKDKNQANVNWYQYSGKTLSFTANGDPNKFTGVRVDGRLIPAGNYSVIKNTAEGTTTVGLYPGYLATLAYGKHSIDIVFTDGFAIEQRENLVDSFVEDLVRIDLAAEHGFWVFAWAEAVDLNLGR